MTSVLAPDRFGPKVCVGEILVEIVATTVGDDFLEAQSGAYARRSGGKPYRFHFLADYYAACDVGTDE